MSDRLSVFAECLCEAIAAQPVGAFDFPALAGELFELQFAANPVYRRVCESRAVVPGTMNDWREIPAVSAAAFKEFEISCLPAGKHSCVFHSSGTTGQRPSRHFHSAESLAVYEASLWPWFRKHVLPDFDSELSRLKLGCLTPPLAHAPHSSLVHMFETVRQHWGAPESAFHGVANGSGDWGLKFAETLAALRESVASGRPLVLLGTAFSFVHLLDGMTEQKLRIELPPGSRAMETGGYKGRSRSFSKTELHKLISAGLGIPTSHIICEYGMSELSSQAYDRVAGDTWQVTRSDEDGGSLSACVARRFLFPPWVRVLIISPETGREVADGETGLIRVYDLANVWSVMAIQTDDLGIRRGNGFELLGRVKQAEPRGCSLMLP